MESGSTCARHAGAEASFICDRCGEPFCPECRCELLGDGVRCTECAVDSAGESGGVFDSPDRAAYPDVHRPVTKRRSGRFLAVLLLISLPLLAAELVFLFQSRAAAGGPEIEARKVMSDTLVLVTELNRYMSEKGSYPERLIQLIPSNWDDDDRAELERYEYRRVGSHRFSLRPKLTGDRKEDAGVIRVQGQLPPSFGEQSRLHLFLAPDQQGEGPPRTGEGA